jgi:hypothetical protein
MLTNGKDTDSSRLPAQGQKIDYARELCCRTFGNGRRSHLYPHRRGRGMRKEAQGLAQANALEPDLDRLAGQMAAALAQLDCPQCCGPVYEFIEIGAVIHDEELEWACVVHVMRQRLRAG